FIAFEAAIDLLKITGQQSIIEQTYRRCKEELEKDVADMENCVKAIYAPFSADEISNRISAKVYPQQTEWRGKVEVIFQTIGNLHEAISTECGDWYFTGDYPTPAGLAMVNRSFVNFCEDKGGRAYALL
ncbi:MAG: amidophosphoribosyltransferase, partial [Verrucomicrobiae bacterium]|nr:amidophosphoribosyltransferase [Verrucomicrobiae bacterium]